MDTIRTFAASHPVLCALCLTLACFVLTLFVTGLALAKLRKPYGDAVAAIVRLALTAGLLWLVWHLGGLKASGIAQPGRWQIWLLALGGLLYFASAGLYAFYGKVAFDLSSFQRLPAARSIAVMNLVTVSHEEILFRGAVLYILLRAWGHTGQGRLGSVFLTAVLFAVPHLTAVFMGVSHPAALLLVVEGTVIAIWWGALVLAGGSIWPAVLLHYVVNVVVAVQGLNVPMVTPDTLAYQRLLWFSIPLGGIGVWLLL